MPLIDALRGSHSALDVESTHVLPILLQQRHKEVDGQNNVAGELLLCHFHMAYSHIQAQHLLHLELDGGFNLLNLGHHGLPMGQSRRELASLVQARSQDTRNLLDQGVRGQEGTVLLGCKMKMKLEQLSLTEELSSGPTQLLDKLLILVQLLQGLNVHVGKVIALGLVTMHLVSQDAHLHTGTRNVL